MSQYTDGWMVSSVKSGKIQLVTLVMKPKVAALVADALDIINPDKQDAEDAARAIALKIQQEL